MHKRHLTCTEKVKTHAHLCLYGIHADMFTHTTTTATRTQWHNGWTLKHIFAITNTNGYIYMYHRPTFQEENHNYVHNIQLHYDCGYQSMIFNSISTTNWNGKKHATCITLMSIFSQLTKRWTQRWWRHQEYYEEYDTGVNCQSLNKET